MLDHVTIIVRDLDASKRFYAYATTGETARVWSVRAPERRELGP
jgi:catechol 2,3-dioxygenase-like lactoylglutathione lyase family enzyme